MLGVKTNIVKAILERLFRSKGDNKHKILALSTPDFYAFIINNNDNLRRDFRNIAAEVVDNQTRLPQMAKRVPFHIPEEDFFKYDCY